MTMLPVGFGGDSGVDTGDITKSLRFRASGSTYMSRTFGAGNQKTWTWSGWVKRGALGTSQTLFVNNGDAAINISSGGLIELNIRPSTTNYNVITTQVFRDPSSFFHLVCVCDTSNATANDRLRMYINGVQVTAFGTRNNPTLNLDGGISAAVAHSIGKYSTSSFYLDGYLSRICFVDGQALTPSSFGYLNTEINEWVTKTRSACKAVVDAGGTNSFMLDFEDGTSLTTLGNDYSAKNNDWTLNNHSLTAGTSYDWMEDRPGNSYAVLNPLVMNGTQISAANLQIPNSGVAYRAVASQGVTTGKWYWEVNTTSTTYKVSSGIVKSGAASTEVIGFGDALSWGWYANSGQKWFNSGSTIWGSAFTSVNDVLGVAFDADTGDLFFYKNGVLQGGGAAFTGLTSGPYFPAIQSNTDGTTSAFNAGQYPFVTSATYHSAAGGYFRYAPPTNFKALCQANIPTPAILNPKQHFDVLLHSGNASTQSITGAQFRPDLVWVKGRNAGGTDNHIVDSVRGATKNIASNTTAAENTESGVTSFDASGFSLGSDGNYNGAGATFVDWLWKANGAAVSNTNGTITSQVSANVLAGFSICTYTGTGANGTVGHGLGVAPKFIIIKERSVAGGIWWVAADVSGWTWSSDYLILNTTGTKQTNAAGTAFRIAPTITTFGLGNHVDINNSTDTYVAYCFAEIAGYSKIGSYTGNASTDGVYVDVGFKPEFVLLKCSSTTGNWYVFDTTRNTTNVLGEQLYPNLANAESTVTTLDVTSRGFKFRLVSDPNAAQTYIYYAVAETAGKYSNAR
jgi:hypothetical protein